MEEEEVKWKGCEVEGGKIRIGGGGMRRIEQGEVELQDHTETLLNQNYTLTKHTHILSHSTT